MGNELVSHGMRSHYVLYKSSILQIQRYGIPLSLDHSSSCCLKSHVTTSVWFLFHLVIVVTMKHISSSLQSTTILFSTPWNNAKWWIPLTLIIQTTLSHVVTLNHFITSSLLSFRLPKSHVTLPSNDVVHWILTNCSFVFRRHALLQPNLGALFLPLQLHAPPS